MTHKRHWRLKLSQRKSIVRSLAKAWYRPPCCIGATPAREGRRLQAVDPSFYPGIPPVGISQRQWLFAPYRQSQRVAARPEPVAGGRGHYLRLREPKPPHPRLHLPRQRQPWTPAQSVLRIVRLLHEGLPIATNAPRPASFTYLGLSAAIAAVASFSSTPSIALATLSRSGMPSGAMIGTNLS